jgi:hypothetical protein
MSLDDSAELLSTIKGRGTVPTNSGTWTDAALLKAATEAMLTVHLPMLVGAKGEYLVKETLVPTVEGQQEYLLSYRAAAIRHLALKRADGHEIPIEELPYPGQSSMALDRNRKGTPRFFWFREGYFGVWPLPDSEASNLIVRWHIRPSRIVVTTDCWQILSITANSPSSGFTRLAFATTAPTAMAGASGTKYDFVGYRNPFAIKGYDVASSALVTASVSSTMDFTSSALPTDLAVGDWVAPFQQSPFANVLQELHTPIALRAAAAAIGSRDHASMKADLIKDAVDEEKRLLRGLLVPRSKGNIKRLITTRWRNR